MVAEGERLMGGVGEDGGSDGEWSRRRMMSSFNPIPLLSPAFCFSPRFPLSVAPAALYLDLCSCVCVCVFVCFDAIVGSLAPFILIFTAHFSKCALSPVTPTVSVFLLLASEILITQVMITSEIMPPFP